MKTLIAICISAVVTGCSHNECFVSYPPGNEIANVGFVIGLTDECHMIVVNQWGDRIHVAP